MTLPQTSQDGYFSLSFLGISIYWGLSLLVVMDFSLPYIFIIYNYIIGLPFQRKTLKYHE